MQDDNCTIRSHLHIQFSGGKASVYTSLKCRECIFRRFGGEAPVGHDHGSPVIRVEHPPDLREPPGSREEQTDSADRDDQPFKQRIAVEKVGCLRVGEDLSAHFLFSDVIKGLERSRYKRRHDPEEEYIKDRAGRPEPVQEKHREGFRLAREQPHGQQEPDRHDHRSAGIVEEPDQRRPSDSDKTDPEHARSFCHQRAFSASLRKARPVFFHHDRNREDPADKEVNHDDLETQVQVALPRAFREIFQDKTRNLDHVDDAGHIPRDRSKAQDQDRVWYKGPVFQPQTFRAHIEAGGVDLPERSFHPGPGRVQGVIKRELFEHSRSDQNSSHQQEHDPAGRVFDK